MTDTDRRVAGSRSAFRSFAFVNYRLWFAGATVSNVGTWMQRTAQDWIVLTTLTTNDATALGVTMALQFGPQLVLAPLTGYVVDLMDRRRLLMITQAAQAALALGLGILTVTGAVQLWSVFVFALLLGIVTAFDAPARQTFVSELVPPPYLSNAVGLNATSFNTARLIGPAVAGLLTAAVGAGWVFLLNFATFAATLVALAILRRDQLTPRIRPPAGTGGIREGFRYIASRPDLRFVLLTVFLMGTLGLNFPLFISTMTSIAFDEGASAFGLLSSVLAIGSVAGALLAARRERPRMRNIALAAAGFGLVMLVSAVMPTYLSFAIVLPFIGICSITVLNNSNAYTQMSTPPHLRGRVMSLYMAVVMGGTPLGALVMGWVVDGFGPRWAIVLGALGGMLPALLAGLWWLSMRRAARDRAA
jgi:MFS family permease